MPICMKDLLDLEGFKGVKVVAGGKGLSTEVGSVCLADLEFDKNNVPHPNSFRAGGLVVASMRGLKEGSYSIEEVLNVLISKKTAGLLCNKNLLKITSEAKRLCDEKDFPLLTFDPEKVVVNNMVFDAMYTLKGNATSFSIEMIIERLMEIDLSEEEIERIAKNIDENLYSFCTVHYIHGAEDGQEFNTGRFAKMFASVNEDGYTINAYTYKSGLAILITMSQIDDKKTEKLISDIMSQIGKTDLIIASSDTHHTFEDLNIAMKECASAYIAAIIDGVAKFKYEEIGIYQLLIEKHHDKEAEKLIKRYVEVLNKEQLDTAITFVRCKGDFDETAKKMICHRNTVRYRIGKIHEKTDPQKTEFEFYENLSAAIKLYLIKNYRNRVYSMH